MTRPVRSPAPQESLDGFLRRLAEEEFWPDVSDFLAGLRLRYGRRMIEDAEKAEELLELEPGTLALISPAAAPSDPSRNWRFERHHSAPVCPDCLVEGKPHHQSWRHVFVTCCVDHGIRLVDQCPMCQSTLRPGQGGYDSCHCGCPLDRLARTEADDVELAISALIAGKMHPARAALPPSLAFRAPSDIADFIFFLASAGIDTVTGKQGKTPLPRTLEETHSFLGEASQLLCAWPTAFRDDVARRLCAGDRSASSAPARLGRWYQRLMSFDGAAYDNFRKALGDVVAQEFDGAYVGGISVSSAVRVWMSAAEAARILGVRAERIVDAVGQGQIVGRLNTSGFGHRHTMLPREAVDEIGRSRKRFVTKSDAREFLGISRKQYDLLSEAGGLQGCTPSEVPPLVDGTHDLEAMRLMVNSIAAHAVETAEATVAFSDLNLRFTTDRVGLAEVFRQMLDGRLRPTQDCIDGRLGEFQFCRGEVDAVLAEARRVPGMTVQQVASLTGWKSQCIAAWCDQDLITHEVYEHAGRTGRIISVESLSKFQSTYFPLSELAKQLGTTSRYLMRRLGELGVQPIGSFQDGKAWRGHLVPHSAVAAAALGPRPEGE